MRLSTPAPYEEPADLSGSSSGVGVSPGLLSPDRFEGWGRAIKRSLTRSGFSYPQPPLPSPAKSTHDGAQAATATQ